MSQPKNVVIERDVTLCECHIPVRSTSDLYELGPEGQIRCADCGNIPDEITDRSLSEADRIEIEAHYRQGRRAKSITVLLEP